MYSVQDSYCVEQLNLIGVKNADDMNGQVLSVGNFNVSRETGKGTYSEANTQRYYKLHKISNEMNNETINLLIPY